MYKRAKCLDLRHQITSCIVNGKIAHFQEVEGMWKKAEAKLLTE